MKPFLKWVGGKRQLLPIIKQYIPKEYNTYFEPFVGAGALLFELQPKKAIINDLNQELINCYLSICSNVTAVLDYLNKMENIEDVYYKIRSLDREKDWDDYVNTFKAARTIYINKNGFNGLYRVNKNGYCNVPYGRHENIFIPDKNNLLEASNYLSSIDLHIFNTDFKRVFEMTDANDFVYCDPPYDTISDTANFTSYTKEGFTKDDQIRLRDCFKELSNRGCYCMLSNAGTDFIKDLYKDFTIIDLQATRVLNCKGDKRGKVSEVLIMNYNNQIRD
jgi:DNA adenine methylase